MATVPAPTAAEDAAAPPPVAPPLLPTPQRLLSLDVFRGATIIGMILVNNPGTWSAIYPPLRHAAWHGWTPTDLIFPFFLFIVGVAVVLAFEKRLARGADRGDLVKKTGRRALILFGLGLFMAAYPIFTLAPEFGLRPQLASLRIMGVLQRIAVCFFFASLLFIYTSHRTRQWTTAALLVLYWAAMMLIPVPGYGAGQIDNPEGNLAAYVDRLLLGGHLWAGADYRWDPEGVLSTFPALATTLFGLWAGRLLSGDDEPARKAARLFARGVALVIVGYVWAWFFPINKALWTSSYAVFTAGQAFCALALCYWVIDVRGSRWWTYPFVVYGVNAITVFVLSGLLAKTLILIKVPGPEGTPIALQSWLFQNVFLAVAEPLNASLLYALTWIAAWFLILAWMYKKKIIVKV